MKGQALFRGLGASLVSTAQKASRRVFPVLAIITAGVKVSRKSQGSVTEALSASLKPLHLPLSIRLLAINVPNMSKAGNAPKEVTA
ncbi:hypothetical protein CSUI_004904, partial [Cystoisospora suis]